MSCNHPPPPSSQLTELSDALQWDAHVKLAASSKAQYIRMLEDVNSMRVTIGLPPLAECHASVQAREREAERERCFITENISAKVLLL